MPTGLKKVNEAVTFRLSVSEAWIPPWALASTNSTDPNVKVAKAPAERLKLWATNALVLNLTSSKVALFSLASTPYPVSGVNAAPVILKEIGVALALALQFRSNPQVVAQGFCDFLCNTTDPDQRYFDLASS